jgi:hypothetical protein
MKRELTTADILSIEDYERVRAEKRGAIIAIKKNRRISVGPYATFYFENYDTMWLQIQEMLRIEKGGAAQLEEELHAYNPLVPKGDELVATMMLEIADPDRRASVLASLGGVGECLEISFNGESIKGEPERDLDYTSANGKASSVQFVHFHFTPSQIQNFREPKGDIMVAIKHPNYGHMAIVPETVRQELVKDFV